MANNNHNIPKLEGTNAIQDYLNGLSTKKIAEKYGVSRQAVSNYLKKNGITIVPRYVSNSKYSFNEHWLDEMDSQEKWYFLGFMYADGNVDTKKGNYRARIKLKADDSEKELLEKFNELLNSDRELYYEEHFNKTYGKIEKTYTFSLGNKYFIEKLIELGCVPNKTLILEFPENIPSEYVHHFIRGYFDGDGNIQLRYEGKVGDVRILGTRSILEGIKREAEKQANVITSIKEYSNRKVCALDIDGQSNIRDFLVWIYKDSNIYLSRKHALFEKFIDSRDFSVKTRQEKHQLLIENLENIKKRRDNGETIVDIAKSFGCDRNAVARLLKKNS